MTKYNLVNPCIGGSLNTQFGGRNPLDAANSTWHSISKYLTNNVPRFAFTLENTSTGSLHHFNVNETVDSNRNASFSITELDINLSPKATSSFKNEVHNIIGKFNTNLNGGAKKRYEDESDDDSSSSSDSDSELQNALRLLKYKSQPIVYWWYNPLVYKAVDLYVPTFVVPIAPYVHINLNSAFMG
jgi:hypothetical protein